jgi:glycosyltransferase involved in cell wall biosynthesis
MEYAVTIGIPVYNVEKYIRLTMDSALAQTFPDIEFLVLDDCGTDSSIDIVKEYQQNHPRGKDIRIVRQPQNGGLGRARNRIIDEARGQYLYHFDADDVIAPNTIELLYKHAKQYDADIVYGSYQRIHQFGDQKETEDFRYSFSTFLKEDEFADQAYSKYAFLQAQTWNFLIKTEIYRKNNIRYKSVNFWEDFTTTIDLPTYITRAVLLPDMTYFYYCRYGSLSNYKKRDHIEKAEIQKTIDAMRLVKEDSERVKNKPYFHKRMFKVMMTHFYMACAILKNERIISPSFTKREIRELMQSTLSFSDLLKMKDWRIKNLALYMLGVLPPAISVYIIRELGKKKHLL